MSAGVRGFTAPGFERVRAAFERGFSERGELGAACAAWRGDEPLVDLWGGFRDRARELAWERETAVVVFSVTKGVAALALALAHSRGLLDYDARVAELWPEFAAGGKERITVRELLEHRAGLIEPPEPITRSILSDPDRTAAILARTEPAWPPGERHGYHALTFGLFASELCRRVDPRRRTLGRFVREELAEPLGETFHIGLPDDFPREHVAELEPLRVRHLLRHPFGMPRGLLLRLPFPSSLARRAVSNPPMRALADLDRPEWLEVELASANGIGTARALARFYAAFAARDPSASAQRSVLAVAPDTRAELVTRPSPPRKGSIDLVLRVEACYSHGFFRPTKSFEFGTSPRAFGMAGAGGSFAFADPDTSVGYAYVTNRMGAHLFDDPREKALRDTVFACVDR